MVLQKGLLVHDGSAAGKNAIDANQNIKLELPSQQQEPRPDLSLGSDGKVSLSSNNSETSSTAYQTQDQFDSNNKSSPEHHRSSSSNEADTDSDNDAEEEECLAVHTMERDMPDYDYSHLVRELRERILLYHQENPGLFSAKDIDKLVHNDWQVARYLIRQKMDMDAAFEMMRKSLRFKNESLYNCIKPTDFPAEFFMVGGTFGYEPDRKGNPMLYIRVKIHRKIPELTGIIQGFLLYNFQRVDDEVDGKGLSVLFDCSGAGLASADVEMLLFVIHTLKEYFPKGLSYFLIHELPWILKPIWHLAKTFIPEEFRQLIKFSDSSNITKYIKRENLPDFLGGTCKRTYTDPPEGCAQLEEAAKLWGFSRPLVKRVVSKFSDFLPEETIKRVERYAAEDNEESMANALVQDTSID